MKYFLELFLTIKKIIKKLGLFYKPVFSYVINISKLAVDDLSCIMFKEGHSPDTIPCFHAGLKKETQQLGNSAKCIQERAVLPSKT